MKRAQTKRQPAPRPADVVASPLAQPLREPALDSVEKMLIGSTPDDKTTADRVGSMRDSRAARFDAVRKYLLEVPELRAELAEDIEVAWSRANGRRGEFLKTFAERRAQILSLAELGQFRHHAPQAMADFHNELSRYLVETAGQPDGDLP